ncbi:hypothetical protein A2773_07000 [Candidatus Gottesmanbacteria bacterium RIFCSPHIGHO2_01_FULL_39_10]|uniref:Uncharacterized protein n=1 Tax=Candidatus Gottesmanbacteria bacterium RIFCSPHIGHO2_01_FULL_39_10 TaxID=1798375 RepID=A0A1F5ZQP3_9BACT|nr:MAG: hypothetical protein A2773_07000 [Candidatus Gottesmanbacteria bacterium RIFCSPHIGHO2_01_FULL_39_10]
MKNLSPVISGLSATLALILFYFLTMRILAGSWYAAFDQFQDLWFFMLPLSLGFGIQVGLYVDLKRKIERPTQKVVAGNTAVSTLGMIACCAHHLTDVLPIIGLSALSTLLVNYQTPILLIGIASNIAGIIYLLNKHSHPRV